jgi:hypothetical protein
MMVTPHPISFYIYCGGFEISHLIKSVKFMTVKWRVSMAPMDITPTVDLCLIPFICESTPPDFIPLRDLNGSVILFVTIVNPVFA